MMWLRQKLRLRSVNVGLPRPIVIDGEVFETGFFKTPVAGSVKVNKLNLEGDQQADLTAHGGPDKAVYAYDWENTRFWIKTLGRDALGPGWLGENLTVEGLLDDNIAIGDELEIGTARFQVTQPRLPCFKLAAAWRLPTFPKTFLESLRTGFYLRVLREGTIQAGDAIHLLPAHEPERVTVAELAALHRNLHATPEQVKKIFRLASLPQSQKDWLARRFPEAITR